MVYSIILLLKRSKENRIALYENENWYNQTALILENTLPAGNI